MKYVMVSSVTFTLSKVKYLVIKLLNELKIFLTIFLISFLGMVVFTNADMFWEKLFAEEIQIDEVKDHSTVKINTLGVLHLQENDKIESTGKDSHDIEGRLEVVASSMQAYQNRNYIVENKKFDDVEMYLKDKRKDQLFDFNVLPPTDRIVIPWVGLDVPVIDNKMNNVLDFTSKDFDDDLMSGVVKYPTTPAPGINGNTLLFGHTSQEWWKNNDYSTVFNKLPQIKKGDTISVVWEWKLYNYKMVAKEIVYPKWVEWVYQKYQKVDEDYLTLMGCYPLGSARKRILVIAKRVEA